jgi:hypothetical protein
MSVLLRVVAVLELLGGLIWAGGFLLAGRDCGQFISHAPTYRACIESAGPQAGAWLSAIAIVLCATFVALVFFALATVLDRTEQNRQMLQAIQARLGEPGAAIAE